MGRRVNAYRAIECDAWDRLAALMGMELLRRSITILRITSAFGTGSCVRELD